MLEQAGVETPTTYEEVVAAAEAIRAAGIMEQPFAMNTKAGWNLAEEFVNMYMGTGAQHVRQKAAPKQRSTTNRALPRST